MDSDWQKPVTRKARQIHEQAQGNGLGETQPVGGKVIQQNTFDHPDKNHLRTTLRDGSQVETDEIYIGLDKRGVHYALPVQAKGQRERIGMVQIEQDFEMYALKFPQLDCRAIAAQLMGENLISLFEFEQTLEGMKVASEKHYRLVNPNELSPEELQSYLVRQN